jgi:hypothetical protein
MKKHQCWSVYCLFWQSFLARKEEAPEATTNQTIEVTKEAPAEEKPDGTSISVGTDGLMWAQNGTSSTSVNVSGGKAKVEVKK